MYAVLINGSARAKGNTGDLLQAVAKPLQAAGWETEFVHLGGKGIRGCLGCMRCWEMKNRTCVIQDDCFHDIFGKMLKADAMIIGSPTYYSSMNADTKALVDRAGFVAGANGRLFDGKIGGAVAAVRRAGGVHVVEGIHRMYLISGMIITGSTYWNMGIGLAPGEVEKDAEGMNNMEDLGRRIAALGKALAPQRGGGTGKE